MSEYFRNPKSLGANVKVELYLSNYATKADLKNATAADLDTSDFANLKSDVDRLDIHKLKNVPNSLSNLKSKLDKLVADKLVPVPIDLSKLKDVVKTGGVYRKDVYNARIKNIEDKIPDIINLATNTSLNAKTNKVKNEKTRISNLATIAAINAKINEVKNIIPNITNLASNADLTADEYKIPDHSKYINNPELNKLTADNFTARLAQANLEGTNDITNFVKKTGFDKLKNLNTNFELLG